MNRADFIKNLAELLADMPPAEREEAIQYYNDYFDDAGVENEQGVIASLGTPEQLAETIKAGLFDGGNAGEFTEKGFSGYEPKSNNEVLNLNRQSGAAGENSGNNGSNAWQQGSAGGESGAWQSGGADNGNGAWRTGGADSESGAWRTGGAGNESGAWQPNRENGYGYRRNNGTGAGTDTRTGAGYQNPYDSQGSSSGEKKQTSGGKIALIVILCILASPVLLGLGVGGIGAMIGIFSALFGIVIGFGASALGLIVAGICLFVYGIVLLFGTPLGGLCMIGAAMICMGIGLFFLWIVVMLCGALLPLVIKGIESLFRKIFHKGGEMA